jgi:hypothetical protein
MAFPILAAALAAGSLLEGRKARKAAERAQKPQTAIANQQLQLFKGTAPSYSPIVEEYKRLADIGGQGLLPSQQYQLEQARQNINQLGQRATDAITHRFNQSGIGGSTLAAALARAQQDAVNEEGQAVRQAYANADQERQSRLAQYLSSLSPGLGLGQSAAGIYGGQQAMANQQAQQAYGGLGSALGAYLQHEQLRRLGRAGNTAGGSDVYDPFTGVQYPGWYAG